MKSLFSSRRGTTLVELMAAMGLMSLMMTLSAGCLFSGAAVMRRVEVQNNAQVLLDTVLETLRSDIENACGYIKLYESGMEAADQEGVLTAGAAIEYLDASGDHILLTVDGVETGRLVRWTCAPLAEEGGARYRQDDGTCEEVLNRALYQGLSLKLQFSPLEDTAAILTAEAYQKGGALVARQSVRADLRHKPQWITAVTATDAEIG